MMWAIHTTCLWAKAASRRMPNSCQASNSRHALRCWLTNGASTHHYGTHVHNLPKCRFSVTNQLVAKSGMVGFNPSLSGISSATSRYAPHGESSYLVASSIARGWLGVNIYRNPWIDQPEYSLFTWFWSILSSNSGRNTILPKNGLKQMACQGTPGKPNHLETSPARRRRKPGSFRKLSRARIANSTSQKELVSN